MTRIIKIKILHHVNSYDLLAMYQQKWQENKDNFNSCCIKSALKGGKMFIITNNG